MAHRGELLVAILNNQRDFALVQEQNWYRIPVSSVEKWLKRRWPPAWLAFYQTKVFGSEAYSIRHFARVLHIERATRRELFPNDPEHVRGHRLYYKLVLGPLQTLPEPIFSRRWRRIVFIPTTLEKFYQATEINDLYDDSPLEDQLWAVFKRFGIQAERQEFLTIGTAHYALDFAVYCHKGQIDVETDGDTWHANPEKAKSDNLRDNALEAAGWHVLRFTTQQVRETAESYCIQKVAKTINRLGGIDSGRLVPRPIDLDPGSAYQPSLFDDL